MTLKSCLVLLLIQQDFDLPLFRSELTTTPASEQAAQAAEGIVISWKHGWWSRRPRRFGKQAKHVARCSFGTFVEYIIVLLQYLFQISFPILIFSSVQISNLACLIYRASNFEELCDQHVVLFTLYTLCAAAITWHINLHANHGYTH